MALIRFKERDSMSTHVDEVSKIVGEHGRMKNIVQSFTSQAIQWWETHTPRLCTWTTATTYFVEIFRGNNLCRN
jgi:hypothetical protein